MKILELILKSRLALSLENELELNYLFGKQFSYIYSKRLKEFQFIKRKKPKFTGIFFQCLIFFYNILKNFTLIDDKVTNKQIYFFSGTINQLETIKTTLIAIKNTGHSYNLSVFKNLKNNEIEKNGLKVVKFNTKVVACSFVLFSLFVIPLYRRLKKENKKIEISWYFNKFCDNYIYLPYFLNELEKIKPKLIVVSNDHTSYSRCLRLSAEILKINTLYMQHASVSNLYPTLQFDYALLDGKVANQIYENCYEMNKNINKRVKKNISNCKIILSGVKKLVSVENKKKNNSEIQIGIAVNKQDDFKYLKILLNHLKNIKFKCSIRTHPYQNLIFVKKLNKFIKNDKDLVWSNPNDQSVKDYFNSINVLIAGNTSIHLEAALAGLPTFYYEMTKVAIVSDYYGYVKNNVSEKLSSNFTIKEFLIMIDKINNSVQRYKFIKKYSETYGSKWQNKEGELSQIIISRILNNKSLEDLFNIQKSKIYDSVLFLKKDSF